MASIFDTPTRPGQRPSATSGPLYPDLPSELQTPVRRPDASPGHTPFPGARPNARSTLVSRAPSTAVRASPAARASPASGAAAAADQLPVVRAAKNITEVIQAEKKYPPLDDIVAQGQSSVYEQREGYPWEPYLRSMVYTIPDVIFEQYNQATSHTMMGLFADVKQAWITVDNRLYIWDYVSQSNFQGYEAQPHTITAVRLVKPKSGVFVEEVNHLLVIATTNEVLLLGIGAASNGRDGFDLTIYNTAMYVPTKGADVSVIEGSDATGRIFFGGNTDNHLYEFIYRAEERWFRGKCSKECVTSTGATNFNPTFMGIFGSGPRDTEHVKQIAIDDSRGLLYTLSSKSGIRVFSFPAASDQPLKEQFETQFGSTLANVSVMIGSTPEVGPKTPIQSISTVTASQAKRLHLIATTTAGVRLYMSAATSYLYSGPPNSMQVTHIRWPPGGTAFRSPVYKAVVFQPGYFFCVVGTQVSDELFLAAPDSAKMAVHDSQQSRAQLLEVAMKVDLHSRVQACELITPPFSASAEPSGFGNEMATQFEKPSTEVAILTNSGIYCYRRRRLVEIFETIIRYGSSVSPLGVDGEARKFAETYGRSEACASALAVACGANSDAPADPQAKVQDVDVLDLARRLFIELGGKPMANDGYVSDSLPSLDSIRVSGRAEGLSLYLARILRNVWRSKVFTEAKTPAGTSTYSPTTPPADLKRVQEQLMGVSRFLQDNRSFIVGLSGAESLMAAGSKIEEVANQAEHRMLHSLVTLIDNIIEGISFMTFLFDSKLDDILMSLTPENLALANSLEYHTLFASPSGQNLAKELVICIFNMSIAQGMRVDDVADALRRRCGSFCSADDVVVFKAVEQVRKAKVEADPETKRQALRESLRLFEETAANLSMDNLRQTISDYVEVQYYPGAIQLALRVASESDPGNFSLAYLDGPPADPQSSAGQIYNKRIECYNLVFEVLTQLDINVHATAELIDGLPSPETRLRNETWNLIYGSPDELFHFQLYDWMLTSSLADRLIEVDSPFILSYLTRRAVKEIQLADLLWQYHARRENFVDAAEVLHGLAQSDFDLRLEKRLEYMSRARGFCNSYGPPGSRQRMNELSQQIQEELDVAVIQDDILKAILTDGRISAKKKESLRNILDGSLISLTELFNKYTEPYSYWEICLAIFQSADYRGTTEIRKCWEELITQTHENALEHGQVPFEKVAGKIRSLGKRFSLSETILPPNVLIPILETYAYENQRDVGPSGWVVEALLDAGMQHETVLSVLEDIVYRDEVPFRGQARRRLVGDAVLVAEKWWGSVVKRGRETAAFRRERVAETLRGICQVVQAPQEAERTEALLREVGRRLGA